jgi:hypothetical protein
MKLGVCGLVVAWGSLAEEAGEAEAGEAEAGEAEAEAAEEEECIYRERDTSSRISGVCTREIVFSSTDVARLHSGSSMPVRCVA